MGLTLGWIARLIILGGTWRFACLPFALLYIGWAAAWKAELRDEDAGRMRSPPPRRAWIVMAINATCLAMI